MATSLVLLGSVLAVIVYLTKTRRDREFVAMVPLENGRATS